MEMYVARDNFYSLNVPRTYQKIGHAWCTLIEIEVGVLNSGRREVRFYYTCFSLPNNFSAGNLVLIFKWSIFLKKCESYRCVEEWGFFFRFPL